MDGNPSAPFRDQAQIDGVRRALRFLVDVRQNHLEQGLRDELTSRQISYLQHCLASLWDDSASESSGGSELEMIQLAGVQERACYAADVRPAASELASSSSGPAQEGGASAASTGRPERVSWADALGEVPPPGDGGASPVILPSPVHPSRGMEQEEDDTTPRPRRHSGSTASVQEQDPPEMEPEPAPEAGGRPPQSIGMSVQEQYDRLGNVWQWPNDVLDNQWRASRQIAMIRFPCLRDVPAGLPPVETWPYYSNARRLQKQPGLLGSLECQYKCDTCKTRRCGRDVQPLKRTNHFHHDCDGCHRDIERAIRQGTVRSVSRQR